MPPKVADDWVTKEGFIEFVRTFNDRLPSEFIDALWNEMLQQCHVREIAGVKQILMHSYNP